MSKLIKCDVKGCGTVDALLGEFPGQHPTGWRQLTESRIQRPEPLPGSEEVDRAGCAMALAIGNKIGLPAELMEMAAAAASTRPSELPGYPVMVTFDICPLHDMPEFVQPPDAPAPLHVKP